MEKAHFILQKQIAVFVTLYTIPVGNKASIFPSTTKRSVSYGVCFELLNPSLEPIGSLFKTEIYSKTGHMYEKLLPESIIVLLRRLIITYIRLILQSAAPLGNKTK